jgi:hypothetical protein
VRSAAERIRAHVASRDCSLFFPKQVVMPVYTSRAGIELPLFATGRIGELRRARDHPSFSMIKARSEQRERVEDFLY